MMTQIQLTEEEIAITREMDRLTDGFRQGVEAAKQVFLHRVMRERVAQQQKPPQESPNAPPPLPPTNDGPAGS